MNLELHVSNEDVQRAKAAAIRHHARVVEQTPVKNRAIVRAAVNAFFSPEHLSKISQSEHVDAIESITPVEDEYDVQCIIHGD